MRKYNYFLILNLFFFLSFFGSIFQSIYVYDPFHWGLAQSSLELFSNSKPYKDIFLHYGFLYTFTNSIILKFSNDNLIYTMYLSAFFYSAGNYLLCLMIYKKFQLKSVYFLPLLIFLLHPFANHPWYNYQFYLFIVLSIYFFLNEKNYGIFLTGLFISLSCLVYENFIYLGFFIILIICFLKRNLHQNFLIFIGFLIPQFLFHLYLYNFELHKYWIKTFLLNEVFLQIYDLTLYELLIRYFEIFFKKSIFNFFYQPYYLLFLLILIFNLYFFIDFIFNKNHSHKKNKANIHLFIISCICLLTYASTLHKLNIFRFSTGPIIGVIVFIYLVEKWFYVERNRIVIIILVILGSSSLIPIKQENNRFFPLFEDVRSNYNSPHINFFKHQKWRKETWEVINQIENKSKLISENCSEIKSFINYTEDAFIYMIAKQYINSDQYLFWYENKKFYRLLSSHFDINIDQLLKDINEKENGIIFFNLKDLNFFKNKINSANFIYIEFPYSYYQKRKGIILPAKCLNKFK